MPRAPGIWLREQTGWYCTKINGTVHKLAQNEEEAQKAFYKLMAQDEPATAQPARRHTVRWLCDKFLDRTKPKKGDDTFRVQLGYLKLFCQKFGARHADALKTHEVNEWIDARAWSESTAALAVIVIKAAFNWAVAEDYMSANPLKKVKRRKIARRERVLSAEEEKKALAGARGCFRDFLIVLLKTGMRPYSEAAKLTAATIDWEQKRSVLKEHKNAGKGKARVVYFPPEVFEILQRQAKRHPTGPLLRNSEDNPWKRDTFHQRVERLCIELGIDHFCPYSLRSTFITNALIRGVPVEVVAELVGTSAKMIHQHYASIDKNTDALQRAAATAVS